MTDEQVRERLEALIKRLGTASAVAKQFGVSSAYLSDVRSGNRKPGPKILAGLGLTREDTYRRAR